jgi:ribosome modulation factor
MDAAEINQTMAYGEGYNNGWLVAIHNLPYKCPYENDDLRRAWVHGFSDGYDQSIADNGIEPSGCVICWSKEGF